MNGHLVTVKWLHENRSEGCTVEAMDLAAREGHLEIVKWLHANRSEGCSTDAMILAFEEGYYEIVKYLYENGLVTDREVLITCMNNSFE